MHMNTKLLKFSVLAACALALSGCASMSAGGKNPWAPPERKKTLTERWDEEAKKSSARASAPAAAPAAAAKPAPRVTVAESREAAEIVFADNAKKMAVAYRLGGIRVPVSKGDIFALRGKDMTLRGVARLDVVDGDTLGFTLLAGSAAVGDLAAVPGEKLLAEIEAKFPQSLAPEPAER